MKAAGFVVHPGRPAAADAAREIGAWLEERGGRTRTAAGDDAEEETAARGVADGLDPGLSAGGGGGGGEGRGVRTRTVAGDAAEDETAARAFADGLDLVLSVGGDGTFLRAAPRGRARGAPRRA